MKSHTTYVMMQVPARMDFVNITASVFITRGALDFGPWEQIFYGEFDGRRPKRILIKVIGE